MSEPRVPLYDRLPEIYRIWDEKQVGPTPLKAYLALVEDAFGAIHVNIESLYDDLFIETCSDWVIPYLADLLGTTHLAGDPWTLRADVADTIALRRRKGTLGAIERLTYDLTAWGVHAVELRKNLVWAQHLNHQRPDAGGDPPYGRPDVDRFTVVRGGTVTMRDPAMLSLLGTPFDPYAHLADLRPPAVGQIRYNLPNLAIFLWRLAAYTIAVSKPVFRRQGGCVAANGNAEFVVWFDTHPLGEPVRLFNRSAFDPDRDPPLVTELDEAPGPIERARLTSGSSAGNPEAYVSVETYDPASLSTLEVSKDVGLQLHIPTLVPGEWTFRGADLRTWEAGLDRPLKEFEAAIDPAIGRIAVGVELEEQADALAEHLLLTYTYGAVGPVGAHPISRSTEWTGDPLPDPVRIDRSSDEHALRDALVDLHDAADVTVIEIADSRVHDLNLDDVTGIHTDDGEPALALAHSLIIRAADDQRPIIRLARPLRFRPVGADQAEAITVRLEGLYLTRASEFDDKEPLIARAAVNSLEIFDSTLDPGGHRQLDGTRAEIHPGIRLANSYGFSGVEVEDFDQMPELHLQRSVTGPLLVDSGYRLYLTDSIVDAGSGVNDDSADEKFAITGATGDPGDGWGPPTQFSGVTFFGRVRTERIAGKGGIFVHSLEAHNNQEGCIKFSYFSDEGNRLPQHYACVRGDEAVLCFTSEIHGTSAYGQLALTTDFRVRERGPGDDAMGAFGFLAEAHKWRNLQIRYREFMPIGVRPLLIPVT